MCRKDSNVEIKDEVSRLISLLEKETNTDDRTRENVSSKTTFVTSHTKTARVITK